MDIIIQLIGGLGIIASIISFQCKKHNSILLFRTLNEFIFAIQYFLLGAYTGMAMNLVGCVRNIIFTKQILQNKKNNNNNNYFRIYVLAVWYFYVAGNEKYLDNRSKSAINNRIWKQKYYSCKRNYICNMFKLVDL